MQNKSENNHIAHLPPTDNLRVRLIYDYLTKYLSYLSWCSLIVGPLPNSAHLYVCPSVHSSVSRSDPCRLITQKRKIVEATKVEHEMAYNSNSMTSRRKFESNF